MVICIPELKLKPQTTTCDICTAWLLFTFAFSSRTCYFGHNGQKCSLFINVKSYQKSKKIQKIWTVNLSNLNNKSFFKWKTCWLYTFTLKSTEHQFVPGVYLNSPVQTNQKLANKSWIKSSTFLLKCTTIVSSLASFYFFSANLECWQWSLGQVGWLCGTPNISRVI